MTEEEASKFVLSSIERDIAPEEEVAIAEEYTLRTRYGWVFFYNTKAFLDTGDEMFALAGNGPVVLVESTGQVHYLGSAREVDVELRDFERKLAL